MVKNLPAKQENQLQSLGQEDPLEKRMAIHASIVAWRIPWKEEPGGYSPWGRRESDMTEKLTLAFKNIGVDCCSSSRRSSKPKK